MLEYFFPISKPYLIRDCLTPEVRVGEDVPAVLTPAKPKYHLLGQLTIPAGHAIKL